jgi:hypothetical protein
MKGTIHKINRGWVVKQLVEEGPDAKLINQYPLHPDNIKEINEWSQMFDNIEGRIASSPEVEFEIIHCIPDDLEPTNGETLSFESIKYAKLIHENGR